LFQAEEVWTVNCHNLVGFIVSLVDDLFLLESHLDARLGKLLCNVEQPGCRRYWIF
jgi:hypothetical protein